MLLVPTVVEACASYGSLVFYLLKCSQISISYKHALVTVQSLNTDSLTLYLIIFMNLCCKMLFHTAVRHIWEGRSGSDPWAKGRSGADSPTHTDTHICTQTHSPAGTLCDNGLWALHHALCRALWTAALCCTDMSTPNTSTPPRN